MATMQERLRQHKRRRRLRILGRLVAIVLAGYALHYGWVYIHQPGLAIGSITIHGSNLLSEKEAIELGGSSPPFNFFNVSQRRLKEALKHDIRFQNARVDYHWPTSYEVYVEEREPALYVANSYRSYLQLDYNGLVMNVTTGIPDAKAPVLVGAKCGNVFLGDKVDNQNVIYILQFLQLLSGEARDRIAEIGIDNRQEAKLRMRGSFPILLGPVQKLPEKGAVFMTVFNEIKNKNIQAEYIDLTFAKPYIKLIPKEDKK
ncbi:MAG: FtsQ-type POTRA domain-containing protein [Phascolarctobacterium sp.]|nr:FtsQ-type POTRA domain-containing protein [Phascolarctobacterium sp.]